MAGCARMDISYGSSLIGALFTGGLIFIALIALAFFLTAAKRARDQVVEDEGDDPDLLG